MGWGHSKELRPALAVPDVDRAPCTSVPELPDQSQDSSSAAAPAELLAALTLSSPANTAPLSHSPADCDIGTCPLIREPVHPVDTHFSRALADRSFHVWEFPNFLSKQQCEALVRGGCGRWERSRVQGGSEESTVVSGVRTSSTAWLDPQEEGEGGRAAACLRRRAACLCGIPGFDGLATGKVQLVRYTAGQQYKAHCDSLKLPNGRLQSRVTLMVYLNEGFEGGETFFTHAQEKVIPKTGKGVLWYTLVDERGVEDPRSIHAGLPVHSGVKYLATQWCTLPPSAEEGHKPRAAAGIESTQRPRERH